VLTKIACARYHGAYIAISWGGEERRGEERRGEWRGGGVMDVD